MKEHADIETSTLEGELGITLLSTNATQAQ